MKIRLKTTWAIAIVFPGLTFAQASVSGTLVAADTGKPIAEAMVTASPSNRPARAAMPVSVNASTDRSGRFTISGLNPGPYSLCVRATDDYLDPCQWPEPKSPHIVAATPASKDVTLSLTKGRWMYLRLLDPAGLLTRPRANLLPPSVKVQIVEPRSKQAYTAIRTSAGEFQYLVHPNADMHYRVLSDELNIEDAGSARIIAPTELIPQRRIAEIRRAEKLPPGLSPMQRLLREDTNMVVLRVRSAK